MIIEVYRGDGMRSGAPIIEPLLSDAALIDRGIAEMDANAHTCDSIDMTVVFKPGIRLGQIIESIDPSNAHPYRAKVTGIQITLSAASIETRLTMERPR